MAGIPAKAAEDLDYPTSDGKPMAETDWHRDLMMVLIQTLSRLLRRGAAGLCLRQPARLL